MAILVTTFRCVEGHDPTVVPARSRPGGPGRYVRGWPWPRGRTSARAARFASCVAIALAWVPCTATASGAEDVLADETAAAPAGSVQTGEPSSDPPTTDVPAQPSPAEPPAVPPSTEPSPGGPATGQPPPGPRTADPGVGGSTTGPPAAGPPAGGPPASDPPGGGSPGGGPPAGDPPATDPPAGGPPPDDASSEGQSDPPPNPRPAESDPGVAPAITPTPGPPPDPALATPPTGYPTAGEGERSPASRTNREPSQAMADGIATPPINAADPAVASLWPLISARSPIAGPAPVVGWLATDVLESLAPVPSAPLAAGRPAPDARDRAAPPKTNERRRSWPAPPQPVNAPARAVGASAAASGSVAPPAVSCAIFAALAALAAIELRRLRARLLVPDAPGVPSLRDRPG